MNSSNPDRMDDAGRQRVVTPSRWVAWGIAVTGGVTAVLIDSRTLLVVSVLAGVAVILGARFYVLSLGRNPHG